MDIETQYLSVLDLTRQMLSAANNQEWTLLTELETSRARLVATLPPSTSGWAAANPGLAKRVIKLINEIERDSQEILETVQVWQQHARILLRLDKPAVT